MTSALSRAVFHIFDQRDIVDDWIGVGHHDDAGDAAGRCRARGGFDGFAVFGTRFSDEDAGVHQAGNGQQPLAVAHRRTLRCALIMRILAGCENSAIGTDDDAAGLVEITGRIDDAEIVENGNGTHTRSP